MLRNTYFSKYFTILQDTSKYFKILHVTSKYFTVKYYKVLSSILIYCEVLWSILKYREVLQSIDKHYEALLSISKYWEALRRIENKRSSLRSQCYKMRLLKGFLNTVYINNRTCLYYRVWCINPYPSLPTIYSRIWKRRQNTLFMYLHVMGSLWNAGNHHKLSKGSLKMAKVDHPPMLWLNANSIILVTWITWKCSGICRKSLMDS